MCAVKDSVFSVDIFRIHRNLLILVLIFCINVSAEELACCSKATGSCRTVCEKMPMAEIAADIAQRDEKLMNINKFCSSELLEFWDCMNETIREVVKGSGWWGRVCCKLATVGTCQGACVTASDDAPLLKSCRRSDEHALFSCLARQAHGQECCSNTQMLRCRDACKEIFRTNVTPTREQRNRVTHMCEEHSPKVLQCVRNYTKVTPANNPVKYMHCCEQSTVSQCRDACKKLLKGKSSTQEIHDGLENACGSPQPHDPLWQCFLRAEESVKENEVSQIDRLGIDSAKLHCCHKAASQHCKRLCISTYTNDWNGHWERFETECRRKPQETSMIHCIDEVEEPCELGCDGLSYCTNFNNRPTELFRTCNMHADVAAHHDVAMWQTQGHLDLLGIKLPLRNATRCSMHVWKAVACTLQIQPCSRLEHANRICRSDCFSILSHCIDWNRVDGEYNAITLCAKLSPDNPEEPCISLKNFMEPSDNPYIEPYEQVSSPCKGDPCNETQICMIDRNCPYGRPCKSYSCVNACPLGESSQFLVPEGTYVRIPISNSQKGCQKICQCSGKSNIDKCQPLPCISYDCTLSSKNIPHGSIFYMECNICSCFAGEVVCSKKQCDAEDNYDYNGLVLYTRLPCNCPPHHVPVCGSNGNTYPSACLAKCAGLGDADIEFGACSAKQVCAFIACPENSTCLSSPTICLSSVHRPCQQHMCINSWSCERQPSDPVCDTDGHTHPTPCHLLKLGKKINYFGKCLTKCSRIGIVCGINGNTYTSECAAWADYISVDYLGPCVAVGYISDTMTEKCGLANIQCPPLAKPNCLGYTPPGACCPVCGGAIKFLYARKQIDRALYALRGESASALTLRAVLNSLQRQVQVAECAIRGYVTVELEIFIMVQSTEKNASDLQLEACVREAEKIAGLVKRHSARIASELSLSSLTIALEVHTLPTSDCIRPSLNIFILLMTFFIKML